MRAKVAALWTRNLRRVYMLITPVDGMNPTMIGEVREAALIGERIQSSGASNPTSGFSDSGASLRGLLPCAARSDDIHGVAVLVQSSEFTSSELR